MPDNWTSYEHQTSTVDRTIIWEAAQGIYQDFPELLEAARRTIWGK